MLLNWRFYRHKNKLVIQMELGFFSSILCWSAKKMRVNRNFLFVWINESVIDLRTFDFLDLNTFGLFKRKIINLIFFYKNINNWINFNRQHKHQTNNFASWINTINIIFFVINLKPPKQYFLGSWNYKKKHIC